MKYLRYLLVFIPLAVLAEFLGWSPLLIFAFVIDQIRIEFLRIEFVDYQHFVFGMFGLWLGLADRGIAQLAAQLESNVPAIPKLAKPGLATATRGSCR